MKRKRIDVFSDGSLSIIEDIPKLIEIAVVQDEQGAAVASEEVSEDDFKKLSKEDLKLLRFNPKSQKIEKWEDDKPKKPKIS